MLRMLKLKKLLKSCLLYASTLSPYLLVSNSSLLYNLTVSKLSKESTAICDILLSASIIALRSLVLHSVIRIVNKIYKNIAINKISPKYKSNAITKYPIAMDISMIIGNTLNMKDCKMFPILPTPLSIILNISPVFLPT
eukprot:NODE_44_length_28780_cov_0.148496.p12 type:complete len:139 gc:universal NODE_44_length_28780_cov_0.148496:20737-20321(-)